MSRDARGGKSFGPVQENPGVDGALRDGKRKGERKITVLFGVKPVLFEKQSDAISQKIEKRFPRSAHDGFRDKQPVDGGDFSVAPAVQPDRQDAQVCAAQIERQKATLFRTRWTADIGGKHPERAGPTIQAALHLLVEMGGGALCVRGREGKKILQAR